MRPSLKKSFILSLLLAGTFAPRFLAYACGPSLETDDTRFALFNAAVTGTSSLEPFFYTERFLNSITPDPEGLDYRRNCAEWVRYCGHGVKAVDVYTIQYDTPPDDFLYAAKTGNWQAFSDNSFVRYLTIPAHKEALAYMQLAKQAEANILGPKQDPWGRDARPEPSISNNTLASTAWAGCRQIQSPFLRQRYAFQALRLWYYADDRLRDDYGSATGSHPYKDSIYGAAKLYLQGRQSIVCGWANLYIGLSQSDSIERPYFLVRAFDESEEKKVFAYQQLSDSDLSQLQRSRYADATDEAVTAIRIIKNPGRSLPEIRQLLRAHPRSKYLPLLLSREVNKLEGWVWTPDILRFYPSNRTAWDWGSHDTVLPNGVHLDTTYAYYAVKNYRKDRQYLKEVRSLLTSLADRPSVHRPFMALAAAHLCNMERDFSAALRYARIAGRGIRATDTAQCIQQIVEEAIADAHRPDIRSAAVKARLARHITRLQSLGQTFEGSGNLSSDVPDRVKSSRALSQLAILLSRRYQEESDVLTASLLFNRSGTLTNEYGAGSAAYRWDYGWNNEAEDTLVRYSSIGYLDRCGTPADVDALLRFIHKKNKTPFEKLLVPPRWEPDDFYRDLKGTMLFREGQYAAAAKVFCTIAPDFWATEYEYKSYLPKTRIWDLGSLLPMPTKDTAHPYAQPSKLDIAEDMAALQQAVYAARLPTEKAQAAFRLASAQYQTTYWGKAWMMFSYGKSSRELDGDNSEEQYQWAWFTFQGPGTRYRGRYYQCSDAIATYRYALRAALAAHDTETAARSTLMLACCDRVATGDKQTQDSYRKGFSQWGGNEEEQPYVSPLLKAFVNGYSNTRTFALASTMCPDIADYISAQ